MDQISTEILDQFAQLHAFLPWKSISQWAFPSGAQAQRSFRSFSARLNRLRKRASRETKRPKWVPQGLKPTFIFSHFRHD
jgi:hypothetical protein